MPPITIDQGLSTAGDSSAKPDGTVIRADDCYYKPNDPALWKVQGRSAFNSSAEASSIKGLRALIYDAAADVLVDHIDTLYREAPLGETGSFSAGVSGLTGGSTLDAIHYNNEHILLNGVDRGRVRNSAGVYSLLGMLTNTSAPTISRDAGVGTGFTLTTGKVIRYWVEERVKSGSTVLRRNAASDTTYAILTGDGTLDKPVITRPDPPKNTDATHWALFGTATDDTFPTGAEIAEVVIGTLTIEDTRTGTDPGLPTGAAYQTVAATIAGFVFTVPKNDQPPIMVTGDIMEDSVVAFDAADKSVLKFSIPDNIHAWPSINKIRFETKEEDEGLAFRFVGQVGIAFLRDSIWRVQTLPRPEDSAFQPERIKAQIDGALGITGPLAVDIFSMGTGARAAYISAGGLIVTDGYEWDTVSDDLDWPATFSLANLSTGILVNNPSEYRLEMTATLADATVGEYWFHYHKSHRKGLVFKATGPIHRPATAKCRAFLSNRRRIFAAYSDGKAYLTDSGNSEPVGSMSMVVRTKDYYIGPDGIGSAASFRKFYVHHQAGTSAQIATARLIMRNAKKDDINATPATISLARREATPVGRQGNCEAIQLGFENSDSLGQVAVDYFDLDPSMPALAKGK